MISTLATLFANSGKCDDLYPRQIDLSGNVFHLSIPENFSKDMPAFDTVTVLDILDGATFDDPEYGNLIRRWWDIKDSSWFGKKLGTVMLDVSVQRVPDNRRRLFREDAYNIADRVDLMLMLDDRYHQRYDQINEELGPDDNGGPHYFSMFAYTLEDRIVSNQHEYEFNHQKWLRSSIAGPNGLTIFSYVLPLSTQVYVDASFSYSPNDNVDLREFLDIAVARMDRVLNTFRMEYAEGNPFSRIVGEDWIGQSNAQVLEQHRDKIIKLFHQSDTRLPTSAEQGSERAED